MNDSLINPNASNIGKSTMESAFEMGFKTNHFYLEFIEYLESCCEKWIKNLIYAPIAVVIQSSGHGKSKCFREFSSTAYSVYISLNFKPNVIPSGTSIGRSFLRNMNNIKEATLFIQALVNISLRYAGKQSIESFKKFQKWNNLDTSLHQEFNKAVNDEIIELQNNKPDIKKRKIEQISSKLFIFLDDANILLEESSEIVNNKRD